MDASGNEDFTSLYVLPAYSTQIRAAPASEFSHFGMEFLEKILHHLF